jgi:hypothetical protein
MTDNLASRDMALDDVMVEIVRLSGITEIIEDRFEEFGTRFDRMADMIEGGAAASQPQLGARGSIARQSGAGGFAPNSYNSNQSNSQDNYNNQNQNQNQNQNNAAQGGGGFSPGADQSAGASAEISAKLADLEHRSKVLTTAVTKTLRKVELIESSIAETVEEKVAARTVVLERKIDALLELVGSQQRGSGNTAQGRRSGERGAGSSTAAAGRSPSGVGSTRMF